MKTYLASSLSKLTDGVAQWPGGQIPGRPPLEQGTLLHIEMFITREAVTKIVFCDVKI